MQQSKRKVLEAAGWTVGDAVDFLQMSMEERQLLDARVASPQLESSGENSAKGDKSAADDSEQAAE
jgi:hypothetical protein